MANSTFPRFSFINFIVLFSFVSCASQEVPLYLKNKHYAIQLAQYDLDTTRQADIVMLGNSLTFHANWNELLHRKNIVNRGIISDNTTGYLHRLHYVYNLHPRICFIEGGVNDIYANEKVPDIYQNIIQIIDTLKQHNIIPVVQSALLVGSKWHHAYEKNKEINALNTLLEEFTAKNTIEFLDINPHVTRDGLLRPEITTDGVHLNELGYALWAPLLEQLLVKYNL